MKVKKSSLSPDLAELVNQTIAEVTPPKTEKPKKVATGGKRIPMARVFINGAIAQLGTGVDSVVAYVSGFRKLPSRTKAGYDNFWSKEDGFTNNEKYLRITPQGVGKMMACLAYRAARIIARGGEDAKLMQTIWTDVQSYMDIALKQAVHDVAQEDIIAAFNEIVAAQSSKDSEGNEVTIQEKRKFAREKLAKLAQKRNVELPPEEPEVIEIEVSTTPADAENEKHEVTDDENEVTGDVEDNETATA